MVTVIIGVIPRFYCSYKELLRELSLCVTYPDPLQLQPVSLALTESRYIFGYTFIQVLQTIILYI